MPTRQSRLGVPEVRPINMAPELEEHKCIGGVVDWHGEQRLHWYETSGLAVSQLQDLEAEVELSSRHI
jgi:hypothetical protein